MPTLEKVTDTIIPQVNQKPIPTVTVKTRNVVKTKPEVIENPRQETTSDNPTAVEEPTAKTEESVRLSPQLSALARKEQAFRQKEQALKAREKEIEAKLAAAEKFEQLKAKLSAKDFSDMEELGLTYEDYTKHVLNKEEPDPKETKISELETKLQKLEQTLEESAANQYEETVAEYKKEIAKLVADNDEFATIKEFNKEDAVLQVILDAFEKDNEELTVAEAAKQVEMYLNEIGNKFVSLPKYKKTEEEPKKTLPRPVVGKTLTNEMTAGSDKRTLKPLHQLSEAERYAEARRRVLERRQKG